MCYIKTKHYQEVIAVPIEDNGTEWSDYQLVLHLDVKTVMAQQQEEDEDEICLAKAELLEHLTISGPLRVLVTDLTADRLGGGDDVFDLSTEISTAFPSHMITTTTPTTSRTTTLTISSTLSELDERCPNDYHDDAVNDDTPMDLLPSSFDHEGPSQKQKRRRRRRRRRMVVAAVGCGAVGGLFLGPVGLVAGAASGAFVLRTASKIGERRKDARTARVTPRRWNQSPVADGPRFVRSVPG
jgi:hypothetical protein